jgi:carbohydrate-binding DOMON domain-containing protein
LANIRTLTALAEAGYPGPEETSSTGPDATGYPAGGTDIPSAATGYPGQNETPLAGTGTITITITGTRPTLRNTATITRTPTPEGETAGGKNPRSASDWISLVLGLLMSGGVVFGLAWFFFIRRKA